MLTFFIHSFAHSFIHSITHSFIHTFIHPFIHLITHSFTSFLYYSLFSVELIWPEGEEALTPSAVDCIDKVLTVPYEMRPGDEGSMDIYLHPSI